MSQLVVMHETNCMAQLIANMAHMFDRIANVVILLLKVGISTTTVLMREFK